ncbi:MAG: AAA family ATPase [Gammaproteobacteria bacterium]
MIKKLFVHNFRCLENFELSLAELPTGLLIGKNGAGKSTVAAVLEILQRIARGQNRVGDLVTPEDFAHGRADVPIRFDIEAEISGRQFGYKLALEFPEGFHELRVMEETLTADGETVISRKGAQVSLRKTEADNDSRFFMDWHMVALPVVQERRDPDPVATFRTWLSRMLILAPVPSLIGGESSGETLFPDRQCKEFGRWFTGIISQSPRAYGEIETELRQWMPDFLEVKNPQTGKNSRTLSVIFKGTSKTFEAPFDVLSDGEKIFFIAALVIAAQKVYGPIFCFWDEPDNYLALPEIGHFVATLRGAMRNGAQFLATSHNPEAIRKFSDNNTFFLYRDSHLEPTRKKLLTEMDIEGDLIEALVRDDLGA